VTFSSKKLKSGVRTIVVLRRLYADVLWCYKILFGITDIQSDLFFELKNVLFNPGSSIETVQKLPDSGTRATLSSKCVVNVWNALPEDIDFSSLSRFLRSTLRVNFSGFWATVYISQGRAATYLRCGGNFNYLLQIYRRV